MSHTTPHRRSRHAGLSLIELTAALAISAILLLASATALALATLSAPDVTGPLADGVQTARLLDQIAAELRYAVHVTEYSTHAIAFTLADRDGDGLPQVVRYAWSGTPGDPLTRQSDGGQLQVALANVRQFDAAFDTTTTARTYPGAMLQSTETLLSNYDAAATYTLATIDATGSQAGQYLVPALPPEAVSWQVTRAMARVRTSGAKDASTKMRIELANASNLPSGTIVDEQTVDESLLTSSGAWHTATYSNAGALLPGQGVCLNLVHGGGNASMQYEYNAAGGAGYVHKDGSIWTYESSKALRHYLYGTYTYQGPDQTITRTFARAAHVRLAAGAGDAPAHQAAVPLVNRPETLARVWELDFNADPTACDWDQDGQGDWAVVGGGSFNTAQLSAGVWNAGAVIRTMPDNNFTQVTTVDVRMRDTASGDDGAAVWMRVNRSGSTRGMLYAVITLQTNGSQTVSVYTKPDSPTNRLLVAVPGLNGGFHDVRLLVDPDRDTVNVQVNGQDHGTFTYVRWTDGDVSAMTVGAAGAGAQFDHVRVRVGGAGS